MHCFNEPTSAAGSQMVMKIITEAFTMQHSRDRPSGLSDGQGTNLKVCPYSGVVDGIFE